MGLENIQDWRITGGRLLRPAPFLVAGIVNITPDSFSDGGRFDTEQTALSRIRQVVAEGAHMVDLGAESTRPGAEDIGVSEEWRRLSSVLEQCLWLRSSLFDDVVHDNDACLAHSPFLISIDTFRAMTAARALEAISEACNTQSQVDIINDVSGGSFDPGMADVLAQYKPGYVLGHSPARPDVMQCNPDYDNVVDTLMDWFTSRMTALVKAGLPEDCICLDPCIGFGKNLEHTLAIIAAIPKFMTLGRPLYFGISRKSFLGTLTGRNEHEREAATIAATVLLARAGVAVHRVHNVAAAVDALRIAEVFPVVLGSDRAESTQ